jgi:hypothetical protein
MKKLLRFGSLVVLLVLVAACASIRVSTDYNPAYDFTQLKTYSWMDTGTAPSSDARINNDIVVARVRSAIEKVLAAKGYTQVEGASADFQVSWLGAINKKLRIDTIDHFYSPYGYGALARDPYWRGGMRTTTASEYEEGTLIIDILDPVQHKLIWRSIGTDRLEGSTDPAKANRNMDEAVTAIMRDFPPVK